MMMQTKSRKPWGLLISVGLHVLALGCFAAMVREPGPKARPAISAMVLPPEKRTPPPPVPRPMPPMAAVPQPAFVPMPDFVVEAPAAAPVITVAAAVTPPAPTALPVLVAAVAPPAPPAEPPMQAAQPPDRQCTEHGVARHYPRLLRERGVEGRVLLRVKVDEQGRAAEIQVKGGGSGYRLLDEAARALTQSCRFVPARRGEHTLASWVEYPVLFALQ